MRESQRKSRKRVGRRKKSEGSDSDDEKKGEDTPDTSDAESEDEGDDSKNIKKTVPDAKGGSKKRIESNQAIKQGETEKPEDGPDDHVCRDDSSAAPTQY
jgi:hypothetical protein